LPLDVEPFISELIEQMKKKLSLLDEGLLSKNNQKVSILSKNNGWIRLSPLEKQDDPIHLAQIKNEIRNKWPNTNLQLFPNEKALAFRHGMKVRLDKECY